MSYQFIACNIADHIAHVRLNRPPVNALNRQLVAELTELAREFHHLTDVWVVELSAEGKTFCAGADLKERATIAEADVAAVVRNIQTMTFEWMQVPQPVAVGVQGAALGGGLELALAGDLILASEDATLGFPEVGLGIIPCAGGTQRLAQRASLAVAKKWVLTAQQFSAREALTDGVVDAVAPAEDFPGQLATFVDRINRNAPLSLRQAKAAMNASYDEWLRRGLAHELELYDPLIKTRDRREALEAFAQKRKPTWKGV